MKKPKIENVYLDGPTTCVAINGKIISSKEVSEMIDALIKSNEMLQKLLEIESEADIMGWIENQIESNKQALKKAGCHE